MPSSFGSSLLGGAVGGTAVGAAIVKLVLDTGTYQAELASAEGKTVAGTTAMGKGFSTFGLMAQAAFLAAGVAIVKFGIDAVKAAAAHEQVLARLKLAVGDTTQTYTDQAAALEKLTGYTRDETLAADTVLARFHLTGEQIGQLIPLVLDYAAATGTDASTAAGNLGRALLGNARALKAVGIEYKATGNLGQDFTTILKDLQGSSIVGTASADTYAKQLRQLQASMHELSIAAGVTLLPVLKGITGTLVHLTPLLTPLASHFAEILLAFAGYKAITFLPTLLFSIAKGFEAMGAAGAASGMLSLAAGAETLAKALPIVGTVAGGAAAEVYLFHRANQAAASSIQDAGAALNKFGADSVQYREALNAAGVSIRGTAVGNRELVAQVQAAAAAMAKSVPPAKDAAGAVGGLSDTMLLAAKAARDLKIAQLSLAGGLVGLEANIQGVTKAQADLTAAQAVVNRMQANGKEGTNAYAAAMADLHDKQFAALSAQLSLASAVGAYAKSVQDGTIPQAAAIRQIQTFGREAGLTGGTIHTMVGELLAAIAKYKELAGLPDITHHVTTDYTSVQAGAHQQHASGGIIAAAAGFITGGPTFMVGEGSYSTPFGRGAEAILPLNDATMSRLGAHIARAVAPLISSPPGPQKILLDVRPGSDEALRHLILSTIRDVATSRASL